MPYTVDFNTVSTVGLESSPVAPALAGLRANEARYFKNKYDHVFTVEPASNAKSTIDWVHRILKEERDIVISSRPLEATGFQVENIRIAYVFYQSGLSVNVMYTVDDPGKRAVGFKLSEGMEVPAELASRFKFASQKSKLLGSHLCRRRTRRNARKTLRTRLRWTLRSPVPLSTNLHLERLNRWSKKQRPLLSHLSRRKRRRSERRRLRD